MDSISLTAIKGISGKRAVRLQAKLGIMTIEDLKTADVDDIRNALNEEGDSVGRSQIEDWLVEAEELGSEGSKGPQHVTEAINPSTVAQNQSKIESKWESIAQFFVDFQLDRTKAGAGERRTKVHYMKDEDEMEWPGFEEHLVGVWMVAHLDQSLIEADSSFQPAMITDTSLVERAQARPEPSRTRLPVVNVTEITIHQGIPERLPIGYDPLQKAMREAVLGDEPFTIKVHFKIAGHIEHSIDYSAEFYVYDKSTGSQLHLGDSKPAELVMENVDYEATLHNISLQPGIYRFESIVKLNSSPPTFGFVEIPLFLVI